MGFIYVITSKRSNKVYVGQTIHTLKKRWTDHTAGFKQFMKKGPIGCTALYRAMFKYGVETFSMNEIIEVPDSQLNAEEIYWIRELDCLVPNGYNLTVGGANGARSEETRSAMRAARALTIDDHRHSKIQGMPVHFTYRNYAKTGEQIVLLDHPLCSSKCFSTKAYGSFEAAREAALEFHAELEAQGERKDNTVNSRRLSESLPKSMYAAGNGYGYQKVIRGVRYRKQFASSNVTKEENKRLAFEHFNALLREHELPEVEL